MLWSTLISVYAHYEFVTWSAVPTWQAVSIISGLVTSVINHGFHRWRNLDRIVVRSAYVVDMVSIYLQPSCAEKKIFDSLLLSISGASYIISKTFDDEKTRKEGHALSHFLATLTHISMSCPTPCSVPTTQTT